MSRTTIVEQEVFVASRGTLDVATLLLVIARRAVQGWGLFRVTLDFERPVPELTGARHDADQSGNAGERKG